MILNKKILDMLKKRYFEKDLGEQEIMFVVQVLKIGI